MVVPLTSLSHGAGCGCKLPAAAIGPLLASVPTTSDPNVLVGFATSDDAGVYRLRDDLAIVQTVDFFTPIVDDPFDFGRIAATNALSDVYAMGATPVSALNLVAFSIAELGAEVLSEILRGAAAIAAEAGVAILGGHSIEDAEPKYGLAVTGVVHPDEILTNAGGRPGDALVLTKPLGAGAVSTAVKRGLPGAPLAEAVEVMTTLNRDAAVAARERRRARAHRRDRLRAARAPARARAGQRPGGRGRRRGGARDRRRARAAGRRGRRSPAGRGATATTRRRSRRFADGVTEARRWLVCDAMTSGGLLAAVPDGRAPCPAGRSAGSSTGRPARSASV